MSITFKGEDFSSPINFVQMYSDTTPMVKTDQFGDIVERADTLILKAGSLNEFMVAMFLVDTINETPGRYHKNDLTLVLPYLPGARQDRSNPTGDVLFTARSIAREINARGFKKVISVDPHSEVMPRYIYSFENYPLNLVYEKLWKGYTGVIAPDDGATVRGVIAGQTLNKPVAFGWKHRDVSNGKILDFGVQDLTPGGHYIVVDDICDGGGTFLGLGEKIREQGCYADLYVTHGIFSKGTDALKKIYKNIYTTDSRDIHERNDVMKINVVEDMVNY